jgi:glucose/arabinose dehydrogenase
MERSDKTIQTGYEVIAADYQGKQVPFLTGFQKDTTVYGRPVGILPRNDRSLFVTDDLNGAIYYLEKK